jgi:hypothetical protein
LFPSVTVGTKRIFHMMSTPFSSLQSVIPHGQFTRPSLHSSLYSAIVFPTPFCLPCFCLPFQLPLSLLFPPSRHISRQLINREGSHQQQLLLVHRLLLSSTVIYRICWSSVSGPESVFLFRKFTTLHTERRLYRG